MASAPEDEGLIRTLLPFGSDDERVAVLTDRWRDLPESQPVHTAMTVPTISSHTMA